MNVLNSQRPPLAAPCGNVHTLPHVLWTEEPCSSLGIRPISTVHRAYYNYYCLFKDH